MIGDIQLKVCGLRRPEDARLCAELGADFIAFNFYPPSPRYLSPRDYTALAPELPLGPRRVAVLVEPSEDELNRVRDLGFDFFQIHARHELDVSMPRAWGDALGRSRLWLAPKLPPGEKMRDEWLDLADTFLIDTFHAHGFGGSGRTGDWNGFAAARQAHPTKTWILAGGLSPDNLAAAIAASGARFIDVNSGVEDAPAQKSATKLQALVEVLRGL
jgi:phosphoribosylanthranilate isomerase